MLHHVVDWQRALGEALRLLHRVEGQPFRMMTLEALRGDIATLPIAESTVRSSFMGFTVRFAFAKQPSMV